MIKFYVLEKQRSVVAVLSNTGDDCKRYVEKRVPFMTKRMIKASEMPASFRVCVSCHEDDVFDAAVGKDIAKKRILSNYWASRKKAMSRVTSEMKKLAEEMNAAISEFDVDTLG